MQKYEIVGCGNYLVAFLVWCLVILMAAADIPASDIPESIAELAQIYTGKLK